MGLGGVAGNSNPAFYKSKDFIDMVRTNPANSAVGSDLTFGGIVKVTVWAGLDLQRPPGFSKDINWFNLFRTRPSF